MADHPERLRRLHTLLLGSYPGVHARLYGDFPARVGFSSKRTSVELFEATLVLALHQAGKEGGEKDFHKVYFLAPASMADGWVLAEFRAAAQRIFARLKTGKSVAAVKHVGELFHQVMLGSQVFILPQEPERWVAFGFEKSDPIPEWMRGKLLDFVEVQEEESSGV